MTSQTRQGLIGAAAIVVIAASAFWIYKKNFVRPTPQVRLEAQTVVGQVMAEETIKLVGPAGQIVIVTLEEGHSGELDTYYETFKDGLKQSSVKIMRTDTVSGSKASEYGPGFGMSGRRFAKVATNYPGADAVVSFVGLPEADEDELKTLKGQSIPKIIAFARDPKDLQELIKNKWATVAVVPRVRSRSAAETKPSSPRQAFDQQFEIVRASSP